MMKRIVLNKGREKSLLRRHPWIFSGAVERIEGAPVSGETVMVTDHNGKFLAWAGYSAASQITGKVWSFEEKENIDQQFFNKRIAAAVALRRKLRLDSPEGGCRLIFSEADQLPGVIVDRFGSYLILQLLQHTFGSQSQILIQYHHKTLTIRFPCPSAKTFIGLSLLLSSPKASCHIAYLLPQGTLSFPLILLFQPQPYRGYTHSSPQ